MQQGKVAEFNKQMDQLSDEQRLIAEEMKLKKANPFLDLSFFLVVDLWALSPFVIDTLYEDPWEAPQPFPIIGASGIFLGVPIALGNALKALDSYYKVLPQQRIENYLLQKEQKILLKEQERLVAEQKAQEMNDLIREFNNNPSKCPIRIISTEVTKGKYSRALRVTIKNISPFTITAIKIRIKGYDAFG
jgi:hypothetical protein